MIKMDDSFFIFMKIYNSFLRKQNFRKNYAAIIKCNEKDWKEFGDWIKLSEWEIINSELLIKAPS